jgi:hypothetical protein
MTHRNRIVAVMPLQTLWTDDGELSATRGPRLSRQAIRELLGSRPVRFVVANVGDRLRWIPLAERFDFWKTEAARHLSDDERVFLDGCSDGMAYFASEWRAGEDELPIVLFEAHH